ncbi:putative membrane-bound dehydrogenase-like protein [Roseimicrobium gellanilyticum]|uniref:Putative membrane-bound dehydrogenase-like protein n=1 Tax=Roseimicrobium gellanilyticum TaxID=748857 RepID=A0A366HBI5_9BACT|nr:PVC-type heme-binding CxxCH protein [Roseimicrobium gellanilyticum]RBP38535.1 putative membrane-bound dehydrogenase-like protein [Roseimicrobium gellanilyticum]
MKPRSVLPYLLAFAGLSNSVLHAQQPRAQIQLQSDSKRIESKTTYAKAYGETKGAVTVDPAKDLPRYPAVEPKDAIATFQVKKGFALEFAAHEPNVRSPIAISFDEHGRMFVCEMIDYSEMRDANPHLGRVSMLEDKDGDGFFETAKVFADNLAWPTGLICANGGVFVVATPDIIFFKDTDGDGKSDVRDTMYTGFGTGLKILNVQGMANCPQWGLDNRIHVQAGGGNRGKVKCLKRPELPEMELGGRDFWFDPRTLEFGLEAGGGQYGMSFDDWGRKYVCSNSDHLQFFIYDDRFATRNPFFTMPPTKRSVAVDGGAAEVFRISPDEPWRIIRTRWRVAGVVKGAVEGGGRVSGYFTGATGTTVYRGDAYGPEFVNNTFSGDAGGQLVHRKIISPDGVSVKGARPADEQGYEFLASKDTWVRTVNFANAPDGHLYICDMYREVIEHPWSIPDEIKKHIDLNSGNDRGRIYRLIKNGQNPKKVAPLAEVSLQDLVNTLESPNGWHRDCASRLIYERNEKAAVPLLDSLIRKTSNPLAKLHVLGCLDGFKALTDEHLVIALKDSNEHVRARAVMLAAIRTNGKIPSPVLWKSLEPLVKDASPRVRLHLAFLLGGMDDGSKDGIEPFLSKPVDRPNPHYAALQLAEVSADDEYITSAILAAPPQRALRLLENIISTRSAPLQGKFAADLIRIIGSAGDPTANSYVLKLLSASNAPAASRNLWISSYTQGLKRAGTTLEKADKEGKLSAVFTTASSVAGNPSAKETERLDAIAFMESAPFAQAKAALTPCLASGQPEAVQAAAVKTLATWSADDATKAIINHWSTYTPKAREAALAALVARPARIVALLTAMQGGGEKGIKPADLSAAQVQALLKLEDKAIAKSAREVLASVIPPSRESVIAKFQPALTSKGDTAKGQVVFMQRCFACHRAAGQGLEVGPDLITVKTKGRDALLTAILDPHKEVAPQYIAYAVNTKDGQTLSGIITQDEAASMTIKMMGGAQLNIPRSNIKGSSSSSQSLMPEGLETGMTTQDMADLLDFIEGLK